MRYPILPFPPLWPVRLTLQCWSQHSSRRLLGRCLVHSRTLLLSLLFGALLWLLLLLLLSSTAVAVVIKLKCQSQREVSATTANALFEFLLSDRQQQKEPGKEYQQQQQKLGRWQAQQTGRGGAVRCWSLADQIAFLLTIKRDPWLAAGERSRVAVNAAQNQQ